MKHRNITFINYADKRFASQQKISRNAARFLGGIRNINSYSRDDIDFDFYQKNKMILDLERGGGYWLWKPYFINRALEEIKFGDYLIYSDSGSVMLKSPQNMISDMLEIGQDFAGFELPLIERQWTKENVFNYFECNKSEFKDSNQILSGFHVIKKSKKSLNFYKEFLHYCSMPELLLDDNDMAKPLMDPDFISHRHDQSIFSILYKINGYTPMKDPSQFGEWPTGYAGLAVRSYEPRQLHRLNNGRFFKTNERQQNYKEIFYLSRRRNPFYAFLRYKMAALLYRLGVYKGIVR